MGLTRTIVERAMSFDSHELSEDVDAAARHCLLDWLGVTIAGRREPVVTKLVEMERANRCSGSATVIGHALVTGMLGAALINGTSAHALDYDDGNLAMHGHPSAPVLAAVLAVAEERRSPVGDLLAGLVAGHEVAALVGAAVAPGHYERGFHATGTIGALAAAIGAARVMELDSETASRALALAAGQAGGLKAQFGTEAKPVQAGFAARSGLVAALMARGGVQAREDILECHDGFIEALAPGNPFTSDVGVSARPAVLDAVFKLHASCLGTHSAIDCARQVRSEMGPVVGEADAVRVRVRRGADRTCNIAQPRSGLEAKFSLRFCVAAALLGLDTGDPATFSKSTLRRDDLVSLMNRVEVVLVDSWPVDSMYAEVEVRVDGMDLERGFDTTDSGLDVEERAGRLRAKFGRLAVETMGAERAAEILELVETSDALVGELTALCRV